MPTDTQTKGSAITTAKVPHPESKFEAHCAERANSIDIPPAEQIVNLRKNKDPICRNRKLRQMLVSPHPPVNSTKENTSSVDETQPSTVKYKSCTSHDKKTRNCPKPRERGSA